MPKIPRIFIISIFILSFSIFAKAQIISNYLFLEVLDLDKQPVPDALVEVQANSLHRLVTTSENGEARLQGGSMYRRDLSISEFKVTQKGFFPYWDFGCSDCASDYRRTRIELLKTPTTEGERKSLGNEQLKREFMWAAKNDDWRKIGKLLKNGISPNLTTSDLRGVSDPQKVPAIFFAVASGNTKTVKTLLRAGANTNAKNSYGQTALTITKQYQQSNSNRAEYQEIIKLLEAAGAK